LLVAALYFIRMKGAEIALVTGGNGFLGTYLVTLLLQRGWRVRTLHRRECQELEEAGVDVRLGALEDAAAVRDAVAGCRVVFHVAAKAGVWGARREYFQANVIGARNVVEACRQSGVERLVYTSTPSVVFSGQPFRGEDESLPYGRNFLCHYAETKAQAERETLAAHDPNGLRVTALRPHLIWGVGDSHLVPTIVEAAKKGRLPIVGDGQNRVDITHVRNAAEAHLLALKALDEGRAGGKAYFLSQGEPVALWDWVAKVLEMHGVTPLKKQISFRKAYAAGWLCEKIWKWRATDETPPMTRFVAVELAKDHYFSIEAARRDLGYQPEAFTTEQGLEEMQAALQKATLS